MEVQSGARDIPDQHDGKIGASENLLRPAKNAFFHWEEDKFLEFDGGRPCWTQIKTGLLGFSPWMNPYGYESKALVPFFCTLKMAGEWMVIPCYSIIPPVIIW